MSKEFLDHHQDVMISRVGEDSCLIQTQKATLVLSYDAAYDLALRMAAWLESVQSEPRLSLHDGDRFYPEAWH